MNEANGDPTAEAQRRLVNDLKRRSAEREDEEKKRKD
jgi:hypothetical protein